MHLLCNCPTLFVFLDFPPFFVALIHFPLPLILKVEKPQDMIVLQGICRLWFSIIQIFSSASSCAPAVPNLQYPKKDKKTIQMFFVCLITTYWTVPINWAVKQLFLFIFNYFNKMVIISNSSSMKGCWSAWAVIFFSSYVFYSVLNNNAILRFFSYINIHSIFYKTSVYTHIIKDVTKKCSESEWYSTSLFVINKPVKQDLFVILILSLTVVFYFSQTNE